MSRTFLVISKVADFLRKLKPYAAATGIILLTFLGIYSIGGSIVGGNHSFSVVATSGEVEIVAGESGISWGIDRAVICTSAAGSRISAPINRDTYALCGRTNQYEAIDDNFIVSLPAGTRIIIRRSLVQNGIEILVGDVGVSDVRIGETTLPRHSRILISQKAWSSLGALTLNGKLQIGAKPRHGTNGLLSDGSYKTFEALLFRSHSVLVQQGEFRFADSITAVDSTNMRIPVLGVLSWSGSDLYPLRMAATIPSGKNRLEVSRVGAEKSIIQPTWLDRTLNDPLLLALSSILAALIAFFELLSKIPTTRRQ